MILTGSEIKKSVEAGDITLDPFDPKQLGTNSYDLRLGSKLKIYDLPIDDGLTRTVTRQTPAGFVQHELQPYLDPTADFLPIVDLEIPPTGLVLRPGRLYLAHTVERAGSEKYVPRLDGRSSFGRLGLWIHVTAGFGDLGFNSQWTLELTCVHPIRLVPNLRICQISFHAVQGTADILYRGKYLNSEGVVASRVGKDYELQTPPVRKPELKPVAGGIGKVIPIGGSLPDDGAAEVKGT